MTTEQDDLTFGTPQDFRADEARRTLLNFSQSATPRTRIVAAALLLADYWIGRAVEGMEAR